MGSIKKTPEKEFKMISNCYLLPALLLLLPLTFIPQAESGKPPHHVHAYDKNDDCVFQGLSCFNDYYVIMNITGLSEPVDCGRQCQNNLPECVWWTMTDQGPLDRQSASCLLTVMHLSTPSLSLASTIVLLSKKS